MTRLTSTSRIELRGLRLLTRLLRGTPPLPDKAHVADWIDEALNALRASDYVVWTQTMEAISESDRPQDQQIEDMAILCDYLHELGDLEVRIGGRVFVSYVREDAATVDSLASDLSCCGIDVWLDRQDLAESAGVSWHEAIRQAIADGTHFIACFSEAWMHRDSTYADEEVAVALEQFEQRDPSERWFIPVELAHEVVPDRRSNTGSSIRDIQSVALYADWFGGVLAIADAVIPPPSGILELRRKLFDGHSSERDDVISSMNYTGDPRCVIPLLAYGQQQLTAMDESSTLRKNHGGMAMYELIKALGRFGRESRHVADRVLPVFVELLRRDIWDYKVVENLAQLDSQRARELTEIHETSGGAGLSLVVDAVDVLSVDSDELRRAAEDFARRLRRLGYRAADGD